MLKFIENGTVTSVQGIKAAGIHCGIKRKKKDLALIYSETPCGAAGTFTLNKVKAAPLVVSQKVIESKKPVKAVVVNSGNANACTGDTGMYDALVMQAHTAQMLNIDKDEVLVSSTGVIGEKMPMDNLLDGIGDISKTLSSKGGHNAAEAIMTTDTKPKSFAVEVELESGTVTIGAICKGSGMIMPNMATMLAFIATDAKVESSFLQKLLSSAVSNSFNKISVDGETSTNDMVTLMANGLSGIEINENSKNENKFSEALSLLCIEMAKAIVSDGEGATKVVTINVTGANTETDADLVAKFIANSALVKTAIYGCDANWGRIMSAAGMSGADIEPSKMSISFNDLPVLKPDYALELNEDAALEILNLPEYQINVNLNGGSKSSTWWTCDFTESYIKINAEYRT